MWLCHGLNPHPWGFRAFRVYAVLALGLLELRVYAVLALGLLELRVYGLGQRFRL